MLTPCSPIRNIAHDVVRFDVLNTFSDMGSSYLLVSIQVAKSTPTTNQDPKFNSGILGRHSLVAM
jgi:hypothetical protein